MHEDVVRLGALFHLSETFNGFHGVIKSGGEDEGLVVVGLSVGALEAVGTGVDGGHLDTNFNLGPVLDLGRHGIGHQLLILDMRVVAGKVDLGAHVDVVIGDQGDLEVHLLGQVVSLEMSGEGSRVNST